MIIIIRGTTQNLLITITDEVGEIYKLQDGDVLRFGIKRNWQDTDYGVCKEITSDNLQDDGYIIALAPEDTLNLLAENYYFDVGLQTADGDYYMIIPCSQCVILPAITQKEATQ